MSRALKSLNFRRESFYFFKIISSNFENVYHEMNHEILLHVIKFTSYSYCSTQPVMFDQSW